MNPDLAPFLSLWNRKWASLPGDATPADRRRHFEQIAASLREPPPAGVSDAEHWIDTGAGQVRVRVFRHAAGGPQPCLIYMHGGAWMQGSPETHWDITARIAAINRQTVISIDYDLSPERVFPTAIDQCRAVTEWAHARATDLGIHPGQIAVGGDSAGANLAAAVALDLRGGPVRLVGQLLIYPICDFDLTRPSCLEHAEAPLLQTRALEMAYALYCPDPADRMNPRAAPLLAASHAGLPPAFVAVAEIDPLRDSGIAYAQALADAGVPVVLDRGQGLIHGYLRAAPWCGASREKLDAMSRWLVERADVTGAAEQGPVDAA